MWSCVSNLIDGCPEKLSIFYSKEEVGLFCYLHTNTHLKRCSHNKDYKLTYTVHIILRQFLGSILGASSGYVGRRP